MIQGYPEESSAFPGDTIVLRVSTDAPWFRIDAYRQGQTLKSVSSSGWLAGTFAADHRNEDDWGKDGVAPDGNFAAGWTAFPYVVPGDWPTGVYVLMFVEGDANQTPRPPLPDTTTADARTGKAMIVVKNPQPGIISQLLYKVALFTYQAYNQVGGNSVYQNHDVHYHRPGGGTGGTPQDAWNFDPFDRTSPRNVFAHWDAPFIAWLESAGYLIDYCTDLDVHNAGIALLANYALVLSVGHDEYYSEPMRTAFEAFRDAGGNIAFFSGNTCWWRVELNNADQKLMLGHQTIQNWSAPGVGRPEDSLTGVSFRNAGEGDQSRQPLGYTLQHTEQWPFEGTGLHDGDLLGDQVGIVGYECDGAPCNMSDPKPIGPKFNNPNDGTPDSLMILGTADTTIFSAPQGNHIATMAMYTQSGTVFTAATTDWPRVAILDKSVEQTTKNVIDRLGGNPKVLATLSPMSQIVACDGFFTPDDNFRHAIVGTTDGNVTEFFFNPQQGQGQVLIATIPNLVDVAGFWTGDDQNRHIIVADGSGAIWDVFYHPSATTKGKIGALPGASRVAGFYSDDTSDRHAIVATPAGDITDIYFHPVRGIFTAGLGNFPGLVDLAAFYSPDDQHRHVIVAQGDGTITEIAYDASVEIGTAVLGVVPAVRRVTAYYASDDAFFTRRAVVATDQALVEFRFFPSFGINRADLIHLDYFDVGAFFSSDDGLRHVVLVDSLDTVKDLSFRP